MMMHPKNKKQGYRKNFVTILSNKKNSLVKIIFKLEEVDLVNLAEEKGNKYKNKNLNQIMKVEKNSFQAVK